LVGKGLHASLARAEEIIRTIEALKRGDRVLVLWHDACRVTNDPDIRPEYYSTPKETQGTVFDCLPDPEFPNVFYLIIWGETTSGRPDYYDAIPVSWIARIQNLEPVPVRFPRKTMKVVRGLTTVKRLMVYRKGRLCSDSGGISKVPLRQVRDSEIPLKLVEEIVKLVQ